MGLGGGTGRGVLVIEDTAISRVGLASALEAEAIEVTSVADAAAGRARIASQTFAAIVTDLYLDGASGAPAFALLSDLVATEVPVIVYSTWALDPDILGALDRGARAYLQKSTDTDPLLRAIRWAIGAAADAPSLLTPEVAGALQRRKRFGLTPAELEILTYISQHLTYAEIAALRVVSEDTVKSQIASIRVKLGATSRGEAVRSAHRYGLIGRWHRTVPA